MAGYHVVFRETTDHYYDGISTKLILPDGVDADYKKDTKESYNKDKDIWEYQTHKILPEFFLGFYKSKGNFHYGLDAGILFHPYYDKFRLFLYSFKDTAHKSEKKLSRKPGENEKDYQERLKNEPVWKESSFIENTVLPGTTIYLIARIDHRRKIFVISVHKPPTSNEKPKNPIEPFPYSVGSLTLKLSDECSEVFKKGCKINREISMSSNLVDNQYAPSLAYFSNTTFVDSILSRSYKGQNSIKMTIHNSKLTCKEDKACIQSLKENNKYIGFDDHTYNDRNKPVHERRTVPIYFNFENSVNLTTSECYVMDMASASCIYGV